MVSGAVVSTVHVRLAGEESAFPAASVARTRNVCEPSPSPAYPCGLVQAAKSPSSSAHSKVAASLAEKRKLALVLEVSPVTPESIAVSGALVSTVKSRPAGVASAFAGGVDCSDFEGVRPVGQLGRRKR